MRILSSGESFFNTIGLATLFNALDTSFQLLMYGPTYYQRS